MVWYSHLFLNFPQFIVIHRVKVFGIVNKAEIEVFLELSCFFNDHCKVKNLLFTILCFCFLCINSVKSIMVLLQYNTILLILLLPT